MITNLPLESPRNRPCVFEDVLGKRLELELDSSYDLEGMCCELMERTGLPTRCYVRVIESSSGIPLGEIIV